MISSVDRRSEYVENRAGANVRLNNFLTPYTLDDKSSILNAPCGYSNGVYASLRPSDAFGPELVTNGNFATDSDWTKANATISNGVATVTVTSGGFSAINQNITYVSGKKYRVTAQIQGSSGSNGKQIKFQDRGNNTGGLTSGNGTITLNETLQNIEIIWTANSNSTEIVVSRQTNSGNYSWTIDNISVKEDISADFSFTRGSAATRVTKDGLVKNVQILSDDLVQNGDFSQIGSEEVTNGDFSQIGSELVVNGNFTTNSDWNLGAGQWTILNGFAVADNASNNLHTSSPVATATGLQYKVTFTLQDVSQGHVKVGLSSLNSTQFNSDGTYTLYIESDGNRYLYFTPYGFTGKLTNVSVKEVGQDWDLSDGATITDNGVRVVSDGTYQRATQYSILTVGKQYKVQYEIVENNGGNLKLQTSLGIIPIPSTVGVHTVYAEALQTFLAIERSGACDVTITNISVKEVGQNWNFVGGANMTDNGVSFIDDGTNIFSYVQQLGILTSGRKYRVSFDVIRYVSGLAQVELGSINTPVDISSGVGTYTIESECNNTFGLIKRDGSSPNFDFDVSNISIIEITDDTDLPRIDYTNGTGSLLLESQSTNLITYSEDFTNSSWTKSGVTLDSNNIISPDGTQNASKLTISGGTPYLGNSVILTVGNTYTVSCFVKKGTNRWVRLSNITSGSTGAWFDLENKVVGFRSASSLSSSIKSYGNDWYKIQNTFIAQSGGANTFLGLSDANGGTNSSQNGNTVYVWGFQLEELSYATSYIPTSGSTVTRNADVCNNAGSSDLINSTEGVLYTEFSCIANDGETRIISLSEDGNTNNRINIFQTSGSNKIKFTIRVNGTNVFNETVTLSNILNYNKFALSFKENEFKIYINGVKEQEQLSGSIYPANTLDKLNFDQGGGVFDFYGNVKSVAVFKEALTDEKLTCLTS